MTAPSLPPIASLRPGERLLGTWEFRSRLRGSSVAEVRTEVLLTDDRLLVLDLPTPRPASWLAGKLSRRPEATRFANDMGVWHVTLASRLVDLPEPRLELVDLPQPTALPSRRAVVVGEHRIWVGDDPQADPMVRQLQDARSEALRTRANG